MAADWRFKMLIVCLTLACSVGAQSPLTNAACQLLATQYPQQLYQPGSASYSNETQSFWSKTTVLEPYCVFSPQNANDVAAALGILKSTQTQFAVRGNGHMTVKGAASTNQGVLIALTELRETTMNPEQTIASVGPGLTWFDVYNWIEPYGKAVLGGRYAPVGVSGYLLGGGISYYSGQYGWAANSVLSYELVTADSKILNVSKTSYPDLFWALKGGSGNFGVVTRFDLATHPGLDVYAGTVTYDSSATTSFVEALEAFVSPGGGIDDPYSAILPNVDIDPQSGEMTANAFIFNNANDTSSFKNFTTLTTLTNTASRRPYNNFIAESVSSGNRSFRDVFYATGLKASSESIRLIIDTISGDVVAALKNTSASSIALSIQPIGKSWLQAAREAGGDAIDLDPNNGDLIAMNLYVEWSDESDDAVVAQFAQDVLGTLDQNSKAASLYYPFVYINDAGMGEDPFPLYGNGTSLPTMRAIRQKYDPTGMFQYLQPGGFKLGV